MLDFSIKTLSNGTKELYVDEKLIASGTQEEILTIMRLMTQHEVLEKSSNDNGMETKKDKSNETIQDMRKEDEGNESISSVRRKSASL